MGDKELMWALKNGDLDEVKTLLVKVSLGVIVITFFTRATRPKTGL